MKITRRKFLFKIESKVKGKDHYGQCPKCKAWHKKGDFVFSRRSKRYCQNCYKILFVGGNLKGFDTNNSNKKLIRHGMKI